MCIAAPKHLPGLVYAGVFIATCGIYPVCLASSFMRTLFCSDQTLGLPRKYCMALKQPVRFLQEICRNGYSDSYGQYGRGYG